MRFVFALGYKKCLHGRERRSESGMKNKKLIGEILFLLLVFGVTVYMVFRGEDLHQTLSVIA